MQGKLGVFIIGLNGAVRFPTNWQTNDNYFNSGLYENFHKRYNYLLYKKSEFDYLMDFFSVDLCHFESRYCYIASRIIYKFEY